VDDGNARSGPMTVDLAARSVGSGRPLLILHGLFGSSSNWRHVAGLLADGHAVHTLDLRNHGASPWADSMDYGTMAADVAAWLDRHDIGSADLIGHSMGGKTAMILALTRPQRVSRLVVVDIAPVAYRHSHLGLVRAMKALPLDQIGSRGDAERLLEPEIGDRPLRQFLLQNLVAEDGRYRWRLHLDAIAACMDRLLDFPERGAATFDGPALFVRGADSDYIRDEHLPVIARWFRDFRLETIAGAGHWIHAEQPQRFVAVASDFLDRR
jgi:pimeloyl-ACP methyl ester carboxylesterase